MEIIRSYYRDGVAMIAVGGGNEGIWCGLVWVGGP